jgi:shikimate 5-dehydrogenase
MDVLAADTALCRQARKRGCRVVTGYRMLLHQAKYQFEKYTGKPAPLKAMERALAKAGGK